MQRLPVVSAILATGLALFAGVALIVVELAAVLWGAYRGTAGLLPEI